MMIVTNEELTKKDYQQIADIWLESNIEAHSFIDKKYWLSNLGYVKDALHKVEVIAYKVDEEVLGFIGANDDYIEGLFVADKYRKQGIGRRLLDELKQKHDTLKLFVYKKNLNAFNFYSSKDFSVFNEQVEDETGEINISMFWKK